MRLLPSDRDETFWVTLDGYRQLGDEVAKLRDDVRPELAERVRQARAEGDLADNPALYEALEEQALLEQRIARLDGQLALARIAEPKGDGTAGIGSSIRVRDLTTDEVVEYELVGGIEANVGNGRVSVDAPVGRALVGAGTGAVVEVETPGGSVQLEVLEVAASTARKAA